MDDPTDAIQEIQTHQDLSSDFFHEIQWESLIIIPLQDFKKVDSEYLEDHAEMIAIGSLIEEGVE